MIRKPLMRFTFGVLDRTGDGLDYCDVWRFGVCEGLPILRASPEQKVHDWGRRPSFRSRSRAIRVWRKPL